MTANFLAGNIDIESGWDAYLAEIDAIGVDAVVGTVQQVYDRMYK